MELLVEVRAIVRRELLDRVVHDLKVAGVPRLTVTQVHAVGSGVDPAAARLSLAEGTETADKACVQFICEECDCDQLIGCIATGAQTGRRGDGIVYVVPVQRVRKIRTGIEGSGALE